MHLGATPAMISAIIPAMISAMIPAMIPQVGGAEREMGLLKDQHNGIQQGLAMRVGELEDALARVGAKCRHLDARRKLQVQRLLDVLSAYRYYLYLPTADSRYTYAIPTHVYLGGGVRL